MTAQEEWKSYYRSFTQTNYDSPEDAPFFRADMQSVIREAALERIIERQRREIERLTFRAREVEAALDDWVTNG